jgi:beta-lactamase class A
VPPRKSRQAVNALTGSARPGRIFAVSGRYGWILSRNRPIPAVRDSTRGGPPPAGACAILSIMPRRVILTLTALVSLILSAQAAAQTVAGVRAAVEAAIAASGADVAVVWRPLDAAPGSADEIRINAGTEFHAASTMKVPVMVELFHQAAEGRLTLDDMIPVTNRFKSIVDGSPFELSATEDSDGDIYRAIGQTRSYRALCEAMITRSSNLAANILIDRLGPENIQKTTVALGASGMHVLRGVEDQKAFDLGMNNTTDADALATLFWKIGRGEAVSREASDEMLAILKRQEFNEGIPAGLPPGIVVAHKTGSITRIRHDAGVVYAPRPYVLVVLVRGLDDASTADTLTADISRLVAPLGRPR